MTKSLGEAYINELELRWKQFVPSFKGFGGHLYLPIEFEESENFPIPPDLPPEWE